MKRLLCFFDGTWNRPDDKDERTNVVKLFSAVLPAAPDGIRQIAHYEAGIASDASYGRFKFAAGAIGDGVAERIYAGYKFLVENYQPGDEIYIFGFSRGAFQARCLGGLIDHCGILATANAGQVASAWTSYQDARQSFDAERVAGLRSAGHYPVRIRLMAVWDTVGNLGIPIIPKFADRRELTFHNTQLSPLVDVGLHALSIDEPRKTFSPTFWTKRTGQALPPGQVIEQVWFPGCHANVGGGYRDSGLSDISLLWMTERAAALTGVAFDLGLLQQTTKPDPFAEAVQPTSDPLFRVSQLLPYVRLLHQDVRGIAPWRRVIAGAWRASKVLTGEEVVNESIHPSALGRYHHRVKLRRGAEVKAVLYKPRQLKVERKKT